ncbi:MAG: hypothetical protein Q7T18_08270 [Sedimentisphaerales bacterium]|nr:hypothetical protein [Sedimentisphaerales bacterium]
MMTRRNLICSVGMTMVLGLAIYAMGNPQPAEQKIRIGVFNTRAVALAHGRSKMYMEEINKLVAEAKEAKVKGDDKKFQKLDAQLKMRQEKGHWQVFCDLGIDDILKLIRPNYGEIAKNAGVSAIVEQAVYNDKNIEVIDVTELMAEQFTPDEKTQKIIKDIMKQPPVSFEDMKKAEATGTL